MYAVRGVTNGIGTVSKHSLCVKGWKVLKTGSLPFFSSESGRFLPSAMSIKLARRKKVCKMASYAGCRSKVDLLVSYNCEYPKIGKDSAEVM